MEIKNKDRLKPTGVHPNIEPDLTGGSMLKQLRSVIEEMQTARIIAIRERGIIASCIEGQIWVTRDDDVREVVLEPGESIQTNSRKRTILQALIPSRVNIDRSQEKTWLWRRLVEVLHLRRTSRKTAQGARAISTSATA